MTRRPQHETTFQEDATMRLDCRFLRGLRASTAQALLEYALTIPLVFLLIVNAVNFGGFFFAWITVANAARAGADYAILGGASVGGLGEATGAQVKSIITTDISSLPNNPSLVVNVCQNQNGTITALTGTCSSIPADPEPTNYLLTSVDVTYTYKPFIPAQFQFKNMNIYVSIPPTTVHRRSVMRVMQ
jgi:Flp pilus assembly protein TadG